MCTLLIKVRRLSLFLLVGYLSVNIPAHGEPVWVDLYRMRLVDLVSPPQPPPVLLGCRFPSCFPGSRPEDELTLKTTVNGPFFKRFFLDVKALHASERAKFTVAGDAQKLVPSATVRIGREATIKHLQPEHGDRLLPLPVKVELDVDALRDWLAGKSPLLLQGTQLVMEIRQLVNDVEVNRWRFIYDFSALAPSSTDTAALLPDSDHIVLDGYSSASSPIVLLASGTDIEQRPARIFRGSIDIDLHENMNESTPNVEIAVWDYDHKPVLDLKPTLKAKAEPIPEKASGLLETTPNLSLPKGEPAVNVPWKDLAHCDYAVANRLFLSNRMGVKLRFEPPQVASESSFADLCEGGKLKEEKEYNPKSLNLFYVVSEADPQNCCLQRVPEVMFITSRSTPTTLAHELGHSFGLWDYGESDNVMQGGALERSKFNLPQVYLMMFSAESIINVLDIRKPPRREQQECPIHCRPGASVLFVGKCVDLNASFSALASPSATGDIQALLTVLSSEEARPLNFPLPQEGLVQFLTTVGERGVQFDSVNEKIKAIRALLDDQECPVPADAYVELYRARVVENSKLSAASVLASLRTSEANQALERIMRSASGELKRHIKKLLSQF